MDSKKLITVLKSGVVDPQTTALALTVTTTGAQTATIFSLGVISGKTVTVDWGDGTVQSFTATASRAHAYAGAGKWSVRSARAMRLMLSTYRTANSVERSIPLIRGRAG